MRYGLHTTHKCLWTPCGVRPDWTLRLSYQYGYLSVALNPLTGDLITAFLPDMSSESYQAFLDVVAEESVGNIRLYRDCAGAHLAENIIAPTSVELCELVPYSPELNPAERFFKELRVLLANKVFENMDAIEEAITAILKKYWENPKLLQRLTAFSWIRRAKYAKKPTQNAGN
jgi:DDE superfamily endonuclease